LFLDLDLTGKRLNSPCLSTNAGDKEIVNKIKAGHCVPLSLVNVVAVLCLLTAGCSKAREPVNENPVVPVSGVVHVDGVPLAGIEIKFHPDVQASSYRVFPKATTDAEGGFQGWSYRRDDGLAAGNYTLTFIDHSGPSQPFQRSSDKPDLFEGKYSNLKRSEIKVTVPEGGDPLDMGTIELTR
jgi:hypothetical protein